MTQGARVQVGPVTIGGGAPLVSHRRPCVIESRELTLEIAREIRRVAAEVGIPFIFKASYDKANRSSLDSYRGLGLSDGIATLERVKEEIRRPGDVGRPRPGGRPGGRGGPRSHPDPGFPLPADRPRRERGAERQARQREEGAVSSLPGTCGNVVDKVRAQGSQGRAPY